jgi:hypothetical protein
LRYFPASRGDSKKRAVDRRQEVAGFKYHILNIKLSNDNESGNCGKNLKMWKFFSEKSVVDK